MNEIEYSIIQAEVLTNERLHIFPDSSLFNFAYRELKRMALFYKEKGHFTKEFYETINVGLMCARELEGIDIDYCDKIYDLLEKVRINTLKN